MTGRSAYEQYYPSDAIYGAQNSGGLARTAYDNALFENAGQQPAYRNPPPAVDPTMWQKFKTGVSNYGKDADGKYSAQGSPLIRDLTAVGGFGLGVASFLEQRKTAGLQREALRHDIATAKEHRANRQALGDSWNRAWSN